MLIGRFHKNQPYHTAFPLPGPVHDPQRLTARHVPQGAGHIQEDSCLPPAWILFCVSNPTIPTYHPSAAPPYRIGKKRDRSR